MSSPVAFDSTGGDGRREERQRDLESSWRRNRTPEATFTAESDTQLDLRCHTRRGLDVDTSSSIGGAGTVAFEGGSTTTITINGTYDVSSTRKMV